MPKTEKIRPFLCDIAPIVPLPFGRRDTYSYLSTKKVPSGSLVSVPFGPREIRGVVLSCDAILPEQEKSGRLKKIGSVIEPSFLTGEQILLARAISEECLTPLGKTFRHFLPTRTKERAPGIPKTEKSSFRLDKEEKIVVEDMTKCTKPVFLEASREKTLRILAGTMRKLPKTSQILILVPERIALPGAERFFSSVFGADQVAVLSSSVSQGAFFTAWERIRSGNVRVVVGTRQALFAPLRKLGLVALLEESETLGYKQWDMSPRYDARKVAETLASLHGARLILSGETESETMRFREGRKEIRHVIAERKAAIPPSSTRIDLVNMREERFKKNYSLLSAEVKTTIGIMKAEGFRTMLIVSRSGLDRFSVCEECKTVPRCPDCDRALRSTREGHFRCGTCSFKTTTFPRCVSCGSLSFKNIGGGTEKIEQELRRHSPGLKIARIDERALRNPRSETPLFEAACAADIIIGTPSVLNIGTLPKIGLVAILDTDNILSFPDFQADERFVRMVRRGALLVAGVGKGSVIIQTFRPEQELLRNLRDGTERATLDRALEDRKILRYPPFFSLFRIGFRAREEKTACMSAEETRVLFLETKLAIGDIRISPVRKPLSPKTRGKYERFIVVSLPAGMPFPAILRGVLSKRSDWTFDPDPLSLI
jgi:primosomal protein N'